MTEHTTSAIYAVPASGPGSLDGFGFDCSCGEHQSYSIRSMTEDAARRHVEYFARKNAGRGHRRAAGPTNYRRGAY